MFMHLTRELARAERLKSEVSLLVMDLDNFKDINDTYGHHVGDRALREVAGVLRAGDPPVRHLRPLRRRRVHRRAVGLRRRGSRAQAPGAAARGRRPAVRGAAGQDCCRWRSASARRSSRTTATRTRRCSPRPTAGCTATRRAASAQATGRPRSARAAPPRRRRRRRTSTRDSTCSSAAVGIL